MLYYTPPAHTNRWKRCSRSARQNLYDTGTLVHSVCTYICTST